METIETERLIIRNFQLGDWQTLHAIIDRYQSSELAAYDRPWPTSPDEIKKIAAWFASGDSFLAVCLKASGRLIGFVSLNREQEVSRDYGIGFVFDFDYHGKGYATEACRAVLGHVFYRLPAERVLAGTAAVNRASYRLLERLGFKRQSEAVTFFRNTPDGKPIEFLGYRYSLSAAEWQVANPTPSIPASPESRT